MMIQCDLSSWQIAWKLLKLSCNNIGPADTPLYIVIQLVGKVADTSRDCQVTAETKSKSRHCHRVFDVLRATLDWCHFQQKSRKLIWWVLVNRFFNQITRMETQTCLKPPSDAAVSQGSSTTCCSSESLDHEPS